MIGAQRKVQGLETMARETARNDILLRIREIWPFPNNSLEWRRCHSLSQGGDIAQDPGSYRSKLVFDVARPNFVSGRAPGPADPAVGEALHELLVVALGAKSPFLLEK